jgi:hypothetical protein
MALPDNDEDYLRERGLAYEVAVEANMTCVVVAGYKLPMGYDHTEADLLLRLSPGYPDIAPDMWWLSPAIKLVDGLTIRATETEENHLGRNWQRWSRHLDGNQWLPGSDSLESYLALIDQEFRKQEPA